MKENDNIPGNNPFRVPENYFEDVTEKILASTTGQGEASTTRSLYRKLRPYIAVAASVAVIVMLGFTALRIFGPQEKYPDLPEITLQEFTDLYLNDFDIRTLEENLPPVAVSDMITGVSNSEIIDLLIIENIDVTDIYEIL